MIPLDIGNLVVAVTQQNVTKAFSGVGKVTSINEVLGSVTVSFFESPLHTEVRPIQIDPNLVESAELYEEAVVFIRDELTGIFRRARYIGPTRESLRRVLFASDDSAEVEEHEIYVPNLLRGESFAPLDFLATRCTDTPFFTQWRTPFIQSYVDQRRACRSIGSFLCSSLEIEQHQIAVVRRVLQDNIKKYLLADEVGLGKTIEACLVIREHVLHGGSKKLVLVAVPTGLVEQWKAELTGRFNLGELLGDSIFLCTHEQLEGALRRETPTMVVIDEAHQIAPWGWSEHEEESQSFNLVAEAAKNSEVCLLLSGTPLFGNEQNFLAMLHILSPESYEMTDDGKNQFLERVNQRELLGGMYQGFVENNDNATLTGILESITSLFPHDVELQKQVEQAGPILDWMAPDSGEERSTCIRKLRKYIGENYRLHQRMLRNRREDKSIANLFPGLDGLRLEKWEVDQRDFSIDEYLDANRETLYQRNTVSKHFSQEGFLNLLDRYFASPILVHDEAKTILADSNNVLDSEEKEFLKMLAELGVIEQKSKDLLLKTLVGRLENEDPDAKIVVFCDSSKLADIVYEQLFEQFGESIERHLSQATLRFGTEESIRVLVCDRRGEDGLNLHGGKKVLIHYSIPRSFTRIEQRNGRVNRYSALIHARPVESLVLAPNRSSYLVRWIELLDRPIGIFEESVASLQYILQEKIDSAWDTVVGEGPGILTALYDEFEGESGLIAQERMNINIQEQLDSMNEEVQDAASFAEVLQDSDRQAEQETSQMFNWIQRGLNFQRQRGENENTFRFKYATGGVMGSRTLIDVISFLNHCITGIDREKSDYSSPVTALMSHDRMLASHGNQIYPMRFGQPFVDTIYQWTQSDPRGVCSAMIRQIRAPLTKGPLLFVKLFWLVSGADTDCEDHERRIADENIPPRFFSHWIDEDGDEVIKPRLIEVLDADYKNNDTGETESNISYQDKRIRYDQWPLLESEYPSDSWTQLITMLGGQSENIVDKFCQENYGVPCSELVSSLEAVNLVVLVGS